MKIFICLLSVVAFATAKPSGQPILLSPAVVYGSQIQQQYHSQDALGQYAYGYSDGLSAKQEAKSFDGVTRGAYSYIDANGKLQSVSYTADALNGFRVAATNLPEAPKALPLPQPAPQLILPQPVADTVEVAAARTAHLKAVENARAALVAPVAVRAQEVQQVELPRPVQDTPEVAKAKLEHFAAVKATELRNSFAAQQNPAIFAAVAAPLPVPLARIAPENKAGVVPSFYQQSFSPLQNGFSYGYAINSPFVWDSRYFVQSPKFFV